MIKSIIFDMDGVLLDSETICDIAWKRVAEDYKLENIMDAINECRGTNITDTYEILRKHYGKSFPAEDFCNKMSDYFHEIEFSSGIPLKFYAKEILEYLSDKYYLSLASSTKGTSVKRQLSNCGIFDYFKTVTTGEMIQHSKPNPEIYLLACERSGFSPLECIAVEDSFNGIKSANSAGIKTIMIPDTVQPDENIKKLCWHIFDSLKDLEKIL